MIMITIFLFICQWTRDIARPLCILPSVHRYTASLLANAVNNVELSVQIATIIFSRIIVTIKATGVISQVHLHWMKVPSLINISSILNFNNRTTFVITVIDTLFF